MANPKTIALPLAQQEYSSADEAVTRRTIEQAQMQRFESYPDNIQTSIERKFRNERIFTILNAWH